MTWVRTTPLQDINSTDDSLILTQNTNGTTWKGPQQEIRHARKIPTHRPFKVQYSTYATVLICECTVWEVQWVTALANLQTCSLTTLFCLPAVPFGEYESHHLPPQVHHTWMTSQAQFFTSPSSVPAEPHPSHPPSGIGRYYHPPAASYPTSTPFIPPPTANAASPISPPIPPGPTPSTPVPPTSATSQPPVQTSVTTGSSSSRCSSYHWIWQLYCVWGLMASVLLNLLLPLQLYWSTHNSRWGSQTLLEFCFWFVTCFSFLQILSHPSPPLLFLQVLWPHPLTSPHQHTQVHTTLLTSVYVSHSCVHFCIQNIHILFEWSE